MSEILEVRKVFTDSDGTKVEFPRLTIKDLIPIANQIKLENEEISKKLGEEYKLSSLEKYNVMNHIRTSRPLVADVFDYAHTPQGAMEVLRRSLTKGKVVMDKVAQDVIIEKLQLTDVVEWAKEMVMDLPIAKPVTPDGTKGDESGVFTPEVTSSSL